MLIQFKNDDHGYAQWLRDNPNGYVYNDFGGTNLTLRQLHKAECRFLRSPGSVFSKTDTCKVCCNDLNELVGWLVQEKGPEDEGYISCERCQPFRTNEENIWGAKTAAELWH